MFSSLVDLFRHSRIYGLWSQSTRTESHRRRISKLVMLTGIICYQHGYTFKWLSIWAMFLCRDSITWVSSSLILDSKAFNSGGTTNFSNEFFGSGFKRKSPFKVRTTEPFKKGKVVGMKTVCSFAYIENDQPKYLNAVVGDNNASKIIAQTYISGLHWGWNFLGERRWDYCNLFRWHHRSWKGEEDDSICFQKFTCLNWSSILILLCLIDSLE